MSARERSERRGRASASEPGADGVWGRSPQRKHDERSERRDRASASEPGADGVRGLAIEATGLTKSFGATRAVDDVDLTVPSGTVFGLLGPNGAGKTTIVRMLATLLRPDRGRATVAGHDLLANPDGVRRSISLTGQYASVDEELTGHENLTLLGRLHGLGRVDARRRGDELLSAFGLGEAAGRLVSTYSGGMRRRLDIAASLIVRPAILFLDEPTTGLDPRSRNQVWDIVRMLTRAGTTVLLTTQYLEEADQLAERIAIIDRGRTVIEGTPAQLKASIGSATLHVRLDEPGRRTEAAAIVERSIGRTATLEADPSALSVPLGEGTELALRALTDLGAAGVAVATFSLGHPSLDEVFLALTGHPARSEQTDDAPPATNGQRDRHEEDGR